MKKLFLAALLSLFIGSALSQTIDLRRKITVSGTAAQEVTPDIINVSISLQEYMNGKVKVTIEELEAQLDSAVTAAGVPKTDFTVNNVSGYKYRVSRKKDPGFLASKQYNIRLHDLDKYNQIISEVDPKGMTSSNIDSYDYSKITELRREVKIKAMVAARNKAAYLLTSIDEKLGGAIEITEVEDEAPVEKNTMMMMNTIMPYQAGSETSDIGFKKIKISFRINAVFEIVK